MPFHKIPTPGNVKLNVKLEGEITVLYAVLSILHWCDATWKYFSSTGCCSEKALQIFYKRSVLWMVPTVDRESIILWKKFEEIDIQFNPTTIKPCQMFIWVLHWNNLPKWFINHRKCLKTADIHDALEIGVCRLPPID